MNPNTRVAVCCYAGDAQQVVEMMDLYKHHECPVTVLSPEDSPALLPGVDCRAGGKRAYIGLDCLLRMREHLKILLTYPEEFFLIHDADSICLSPELPAYLYAEPDVLWSCLIQNGIAEQQTGFPDGMPHIAFHPPWFMSRKTIETIVRVSEGDATVCNPVLPFIDWWLVEMAVKGGITWKSFEHTISMPLSDPKQPELLPLAAEKVWHGELVFVHSVKGEKFARPLIEAYAARGSARPPEPVKETRRAQVQRLQRNSGGMRA